MPDRATGFAPGRVNLIGEHTDYNAGLALPFAIEAGVTVRGTSLPEPRIEAVALDLGQVDEFALDDPSRGDGWSSFVRGVAGELRQAGVVLSGARLEIKGEVPAGAGLSSSAALEGALALTLIALAGAHEPDRMELAKLCSRVENDWVGARTGLLDQIASLFGQPRRALRIDFQSLDVRPVALELGRPPARDTRLGAEAHAVRLGIQRAPGRVHARVPGARHRQPARGHAGDGQ